MGKSCTRGYQQIAGRPAIFQTPATTGETAALFAQRKIFYPQIL
jgi:hypothetical protein